MCKNRFLENGIAQMEWSDLGQFNLLQESDCSKELVLISRPKGVLYVTDTGPGMCLNCQLNHPFVLK